MATDTVVLPQWQRGIKALGECTVSDVDRSLQKGFAPESLRKETSHLVGSIFNKIEDKNCMNLFVKLYRSPEEKKEAARQEILEFLKNGLRQDGTNIENKDAVFSYAVNRTERILVQISILPT